MAGTLATTTGPIHCWWQGTCLMGTGCFLEAHLLATSTLATFAMSPTKEVKWFLRACVMFFHQNTSPARCMPACSMGALSKGMAVQTKFKEARRWPSDAQLSSSLPHCHESHGWLRQGSSAWSHWWPSPGLFDSHQALYSSPLACPSPSNTWRWAA